MNTIDTATTVISNLLKGRATDNKRGNGATLSELVAATGHGNAGITRAILGRMVTDGTVRTFTDSRTGLPAYRLVKR